MSRSPYPTTDEEVAKLSLDELNAEIARCLWGYENIGGAASKAYFKSLVRYEAEREKRFGVAAKRRRFSGSSA